MLTLTGWNILALIAPILSILRRGKLRRGELRHMEGQAKPQSATYIVIDHLIT